MEEILLRLLLLIHKRFIEAILISLINQFDVRFIVVVDLADAVHSLFDNYVVNVAFILVLSWQGEIYTLLIGLIHNVYLLEKYLNFELF